MTGEFIIQLPGCFYTDMTVKVIIQLPWYCLYCHMTGEVIIQLPGSCFYTDIWQEKSSSSYPDNVSILNYDRRSHHPATRIPSYDRRIRHPATRIMLLYSHMTGEVIIQLPGSCFYTVTWQEFSTSSYPDISILTWQEKSSSSYPDTVSMLSYDRRSHHPATRIMLLYCHMTGEVIIQLPG